MDRASKAQIVNEVRDVLEGSQVVFVVQNQGISVADVTNLRKQIAAIESETTYRVVKNTLSKLAAKEVEKFHELPQLLSGPCALAASNDPVSLAKVLVKFAEKNDAIKIAGGVFEEKLLNENDVVSLSKMPSLDEVRATIVMALKAPAGKIVRSLRSSHGKIYNVLKNHSENEGES